MGTLKAFKLFDFEEEWINVAPKEGFLLKFVQAIDQSLSDVILIRSLCQYNFYLIPALIRAKRRGIKIILDVPTPNITAIRELAGAKSSVLRKAKDLAYLIASGPIPYWFVSGILQYAPESSWFLLGNRSKTKLVGNGIEVSALPVRPYVPAWTGDRLDLICVASLNYWHGIDRLISAISIVNSGDQQLKIHLKVVGKGAVFNQLKSQVEDLNLGKYIQFMGFLKGEELFSQYSTAHLAVGSLALFRKQLSTASELKSREYCAVGIPFIAVGEDPDFGKDAKFRIQLSNEESIEDLIQFFKNFNPEQINFSPAEIRGYAEQHLDFSVKIAQILQ
jgi:glycosyltransferase involved in cell wall biosynthesis